MKVFIRIKNRLFNERKTDGESAVSKRRMRPNPNNGAIVAHLLYVNSCGGDSC